MATKTITIDEEAYDRLRRARRTPDESFSRVIKRAHWPGAPKTAAAFLESLKNLPVLDEETLERLEQVQRSDVPPADPWESE